MASATHGPRPVRLSTLPRHPAFRAGMRDMALVAAGTAAWALMTGVAMASSGLSTSAVLLMGTLVFAGSSQLACLPLLVAHAPAWVILAAAFCVNLRFVVFSAHLRPYAMHRGPWTRMIAAYLMGDLNYVLFTRRFATPATDHAELATQDAYWLGLGVVGWLCWVVPSLVGIAFAHAIPVSWGLGFAGILALIGITCSLIRTGRRALAAGISAVVALATYTLPLKLDIVVAITAAVACSLLLERVGARATSGMNEK